jgi:hypothetical protein
MTAGSIVAWCIAIKGLLLLALIRGGSVAVVAVALVAIMLAAMTAALVTM